MDSWRNSTLTPFHVFLNDDGRHPEDATEDEE
jgi:hypothetical protein